MLTGCILVVFVLPHENIHGLDMEVNDTLQQILNKMLMLSGVKVLNESNSQIDISVYKHISGAYQILNHLPMRKNQL